MMFFAVRDDRQVAFQAHERPGAGEERFLTLECGGVGIGGARHLFRVAPNGNDVEQMTHGERRLNGIDISMSGTR